MRQSLLLGLLISSFSITLHFLPIWENMLNRGAETWDEKPLPHDYIDGVIALHSDGSDAAFVRRPLTTWIVNTLHTVGLPLKTSFIGVGWFGFLVAGMLVFGIARQLGAEPRVALWSQALFHLSPTVLLAWFDPIYTYDDPLQYATLFAAMLLCLRQRWVAFALAFAVALIARETSLLLLPAFVLIAPQRRAAILASTAAVAIFGWWLLVAPVGTSSSEITADVIRRAEYTQINFSVERFRETIGFIVLTLALPLFLLFRNRSSYTKPWMNAFLVVVLLNTPLVLVSADAREARLLALPLIIGWPLLGIALHKELEKHGGWLGLLLAFRKPQKAFALFVLTGSFALLAYTFFILTATWQQDNLFHEMLIAHLAFMTACVLAPLKRRAT